MAIEISQLARYSAAVPQKEQQADHTVQPDLLLVGAGNSGEAVVQRMDALACGDGQRLATLGINNDALAPRPLPVRCQDGTTASVQLDYRLILSGDNPRDQVHTYPILAQRYEALLRGIPVWETYPRAGYGGHGHPVISALDLDLQIAEVTSFLRRGLQRLRDDGADQGGPGGWAQLARQIQRRSTQRNRLLRIAVIGGGSGSMGNAAHHRIPYLLRHYLRELGITEYELWGFVLGPQAFTGLTPFTLHNYRALMLSLDHLTRHGQHCAYHNGLTIAMKAPPYDRLFVLDDPMLPGGGSRVSESELDSFLNQTALSTYLLLTRGTVWQTLASHLANDTGMREDGRLRYLHTVRAVMADVDRTSLRDLLAARIEAGVLETLAGHLARV